MILSATKKWYGKEKIELDFHSKDLGYLVVFDKTSVFDRVDYEI